MNKIGHIFLNPIELDLIPSRHLPPGLYHITVSAVLIRPDDPYSYESYCSSWHSRGDTQIIFGDDVYSVIYTITSLDRRNNFDKHFSMLKSELILLNLANKLVGHPTTS